MCNKLNEQGSTPFDGRVCRAEKLLEHLISENESYHSHKETMAHAGLLVMLSVCGGIITLRQWPPVWVPQLHLSTNCVTFLLFFLLWVLLHIYIRWQLRNRRTAAIKQIGAYRAFFEWVSRDPQDNDLLPLSSQSSQFSARRGFATFLYHIIPFPYANLRYSLQNCNYPKWLYEAIDKQIEKGAGSIFGEWLVTLGSFFVLIMVAIRTF